MKTLLTTMVAAVILAANVFAQTNEPPANEPLKWLQILSTETNDWTFAVAPSYAEGLKNSDGDKAEFGVGFAAMYRVSPFAKAGVRMDYLADDFYIGSAQAQLELPLKVFGRPVVPFTYGGFGTPFSGAGGENGDPVYIVGAGIYSEVYRKDRLGVGLLYAAERWSNLQNDPTVHRFGVAVSFKW